jgi:hypothetical protein
VNLTRIPVTWSGIGGLPGVSVFYADAAVSTAVAALLTMFNTRKADFPNALQFNIPGAGDVIDSATGDLIGTWTMGGSGIITGTGGAVGYAAGTGLRLRWLTAGIVNGRRVRGSTFITSLVASLYDASGTIVNASVTNWQTAGAAIVADGSFRIWSRPYTFDPAHPDIPTRAGTTHILTGVTVPDQVTSLRSRRV